MKVTKEEKRVNEEISNNITKIRNKKYGNINYNIKKIENYYTRKKFTEDTLFYRIDKLETALMLQNELFGFGLNTLLAIIFSVNILNDILLEKRSSLYVTIVFLSTIFIVGWFASKYIKSHPTIEQGRNNYLIKKEIEIITGIIEGSNKSKY